MEAWRSPDAKPIVTGRNRALTLTKQSPCGGVARCRTGPALTRGLSSSALLLLVDRLDDCARTDLPVGEDVGAQAAPVDQAAERALRGEAFQVGARLT